MSHENITGVIAVIALFVGMWTGYFMGRRK